jgi:bacteriocin-like protein
MKKKKICLRGLSEILSEKELKNVLGGSGNGGYGGETSSYTGTCGWMGYSADGILVSGCNTSQGHAIEMATMWSGGYWCCDRCSSTSYCG